MEEMESYLNQDESVIFGSKKQGAFLTLVQNPYEDMQEVRLMQGSQNQRKGKRIILNMKQNMSNSKLSVNHKAKSR